MVLFNRGFFLLWQGQLASQLGNQAFLIATAYFAFEQTGSTTLVGAVMMASTIPLATFGPIGGAVADRHSRRAILIVSDLVRALAVGGLGMLLLWRPDATGNYMVLVVLVAAVNGTMAAIFSPALQAIIPDLVPKDRLAPANSMNQLSTQATALAGQALGGILYIAWGAAWLLLLDAFSFAYGALATSFIPADRRDSPPSLRLAARKYLVETQEGIAYVRGRPGMIPLLAVFAGVNFLFMPVFVLLPLYVHEVLDRGADWYGFLLAGSAAGGLCGAAVASPLIARVRSSTSVLSACVGAVAVGVLALAETHTAWMALATFTTIGVLSSLTNVTVITAFQSAVPREVRGRVMALVVSLSTAAVPIGLGLGGILGDLWRGNIASVFSACGIAIGVLIAVGSRLPGFGDLLNPGRASMPPEGPAGTL